MLVQVWQCPAHSVARGEGAGRCHAYRVRYDLEMGRYLVAVRSWVNLLSLLKVLRIAYCSANFGHFHKKFGKNWHKTKEYAES